MAVYCPKCNTENREGARFCKKCGNPLSQPAAAPSAPPPAPSSPPPAASSNPRPAGMTFGLLVPASILYNRYTVSRLIGSGGMSAVYEGCDSRLGNHRVAIKEMFQTATAEPTEQQTLAAQFQQEAKILAGLNHPNLPRVTDFFTATGKQYLVMDFVDGHSLEKELQASGKPLPTPRVVDWMLQLCEVLQYLHTRAQPIIFRDLKPSNIMLQPDGRIKLIDFGIARIHKPGKAHDTSMFGTSGFAPPEQYGKGQTDARSDVYALCVTAYNLLSNYDPGQNPFNLPQLEQLNPTVPRELVQVLKKGMMLDPKDRWQNM